jgi:hypothetical protein
VILCVDCGGRCHLLGHRPHEGYAPGDVLAYRCEDCADRWDLVLPDEPSGVSAHGSSASDGGTG